MESLRLLGSPRVLVEGAWTDLPTRQDVLLLGYLAYRSEWVPRDTLLALFWPDEDERVARHNLSQLLYHARRHPWADGLEAERTRVRWPVETDADAFLRAVADGAWADAEDAYGGELLQGADASPHRGYEGWLLAERARLHTAWRDAVVGRAYELAERGAASEAARKLEDLLRGAGLAEDVLQAYLRVSAAAGRRQRALEAYALFERELDAELGLAPLDETRALADTLRSSAVSPSRSDGVEAEGRKGSSAEPRPGAPTAPSASVPTFMTPFIGRERELGELDALLGTDGTSVITLTGPGGVGKTRLVLRLLDARSMRFEHGGVFVSLAPVSSAEEVARAGLDAAGWEARGQDPTSAFLDHARDLERLWVFDNFEHVVGAAELLPRLVEAAPRSRVVVTSRLALRLRGEVLYELAGLGFPSRVAAPPQGVGDAVQLFVQGARRASAGFRLDPADHEAVARICSLLQGLPLGIELAAAWSRTMTAPEIADELDRDLALLDEALVDLPERQRGLRAVFEHSWRLLSPRHRRALARLSVFHGGFTRQAAEGVADASAHDLLALVNASLATRAPSGRFLRHVAVHRYSQDELRRDPDRERGTRHRHAEWFANTLEETHAAVLTGDQVAGTNAIAADFDNVRAAWSWSIETERWDLVERMIPGLARFLETRGRFVEGASLFEDARTAVRRTDPPPESLRVTLLAHLGGLAFRLGDYERAQAAGREALGSAEALGMHAAAGLIHLTLGNIGTFRGDYAGADRHYRTALELRRATGDAMGEADLLNNLGVVAFREGRAEDARAFHRESLAIKRRVGHQHGIAMSLSSLGKIALDLGDLDGAEPYLEESLALRVELQDRRGEAIVMGALGELADRRGDARKAVGLLRDAVFGLESHGDSVGSVPVLTRLGSGLVALGETKEAADRFAAAIRRAQRHGVEPYLATALRRSAPLVAAGDPSLAIRVLTAVVRHPSAIEGDRTAARDGLDAMGAAGDQGAAPYPEDLAVLAERVVAALDALTTAADPGADGPSDSAP